jgi:aryl sulfotransferase
MGTGAVARPIEREYRSVISDNRRWESFVPRPGDIFVCTPAKCGTTWMQTIVTALLFPDKAPGPVVEIAPWLDARFEPIDEVLKRLGAQTHRRSIKTHTAADGIPWYPQACYIMVGRDGRDAFMSFVNHMKNLQPALFPHLAASAIQEGIDVGAVRPPPVDDIHEFFTWYVDENPIWFEHVASFWNHYGEPNVLFVHYNDMQADLDAQMRRVATFLDIDVDDQRWGEQVDRCTFESMKRRSAEIADFETHFVGGADTFLYKGTNGRWRDVLTTEELDRFERRARELLPPDAFAWTSLGQAALSAEL